ncbi:DNAJ domain-containing [Cryptosporidium canis]|uniref:DNAJ domain-containing n=1 Tax=Cryptosporidium canis TaxID=195482 RepID=A0ABQ8P4V9_9CRYT|nr:DNAJ domain-containing [Cryptosporidium canis]
MKECHYSVLNVDPRATFDEIRQAYKQLSLKWHPDKNRGNVEEATRRFQQIAAAYEVLSDPNERAWYDSHKRQILSESSGGGHGDEDSDYDPLDINLWRYFSRDVFEEFNDERTGFYAVYRALFEEIVGEEMKYLSKDSSDYGFWESAAGFGDSKTSLESVVEFYRFWTNFSSMRTFSWKDIWNLNQAQNRQIRRAMESENSKERKKGRKEYNETVRKLVEYVKRRDPRFILYMKNKSEQMVRQQKAKEMQRLMEEELRRRTREEARMEEMRRLEELEAEKRELYGSDYSELSDQDCERSEAVIYSCRPCNKTFKSEQQLNSHIKSKKHISKLNDLKRSNPVQYSLLVGRADQTAEAPSHGKPRHESFDHDHHEVTTQLSNSGSESETQSVDHSDESRDAGNDFSEEERGGASQSEGGDSQDEEEISVQKITEMMDNLNRKGSKARGRLLQTFEEAQEKRPTAESKKSKGKKKADKDKADQPKAPSHCDGSSNEKGTMWRCLVCSQVFESRNKLFAHVKEKNHAQIKSSSNYKNSKVKR